ncbi:transporter substrate-binding domain-containing protein [Sulfurimonas sp. SAG-AH-194-C21]|nr:transporter substrate-binding domain-containing protein [Sulfurimonas sp. SAG-AH-194-C21]MDF1883188.1 transporter substrate-binding domain-containing protein [Sulfurimonas sp. SAG-AH-194-C21]
MKSIFYFFIVIYALSLHAETLTISTGFNENGAKLLKTLTQEAFDRVGIELDFQKLPNKRSLVNVNNGIYDGEAARIWTINKVYPNLLPIAPNIHTIDMVLVSKKNKQVNSLSDLKKHTIGVVRGVKIAKVLAQKYKAHKIIQARNCKTLIMMLNDDRIDFIIISKIGMLTDLRGVKNQTLYVKHIKEFKVYMQLHKKHKDLIPAFEKVFLSIQEDGTYQKYYDAHIEEIMSSFTNSLKVVEYD